MLTKYGSIGKMPKKFIDMNPDVCSGAPVVKGTRFTVAQFLAELADDRSVSEIADNFQLDKQALTNILQYLSDMYQRPNTPTKTPAQKAEEAYQEQQRTLEFDRRIGNI